MSGGGARILHVRADFHRLLTGFTLGATDQTWPKLKGCFMSVGLSALLLAGVALLFSLLSLALLTVWRHMPPDVSQIRRDVAQCNNEITELADKWHHWVRREGVRRSREKREQQDAEGQGWPKSALTKDELRRLYAPQIVPTPRSSKS